MVVNVFLWTSGFIWLNFVPIFSIKKICCYFVTPHILVLCLCLSYHPSLSNTCPFFHFPCTLPWFFPWLLFFYPLLSVNFSNISANYIIPPHSSRTSNLAYLSNFLFCFTFQSSLSAVAFLSDQAMWQYLCNSVSCFVYSLLSKRYSSLITQMFFNPNEFYLC